MDADGLPLTATIFADQGNHAMARRKPSAGLVRLLACVVLAVALVAGDVVAAADNNIQIDGSGTTSCESWTANAREFVPGRPVTPGSVSYMRQGEWVLGFLAGAAVAGKDLNPLHGMDILGVRAWFDNYCRAQPSKKIIEAASAFIAAHPR